MVSILGQLGQPLPCSSLQQLAMLHVIWQAHLQCDWDMRQMLVDGLVMLLSPVCRPKTGTLTSHAITTEFFSTYVSRIAKGAFRFYFMPSNNVLLGVVIRN